MGLEPSTFIYFYYFTELAKLEVRGSSQCKLIIKSRWRSITSLARALGEVVVISDVACPKPLPRNQQRQKSSKILNLTKNTWNIVNPIPI